MCHAFLAIKESGERLSHAVGCAFAICLERKQKRERDAVQATYANEDGTFVRMSSFRQTSLSERLIDPQSAIVVDHHAEVPSKPQTLEAKGDNGAIVPLEVGSDKGATLPKLGSGAIPRPRASPSLIERQSSLRLFPKLQEASPFKHHFSVRSTDPGASTLQRAKLIMNGATIPEETTTELEATPGPNHSAEAMTLPLERASQTPRPANFAFRNPLIAEITRGVSPTFPVSFVEINSPATGEREAIDNLLTLDPFSAAPLNPATIQQHHAAQQQQQLRSLANFSSNTTSPIPPCGVSPAASPGLNAALFPISDWSDIAGAGGNDESTKVSSAPFALASMDVVPTASFAANLELTSSLQSHSAGGNVSQIEVSPLSHPPSSPVTTESAISSSTAMILFGADVKCKTSLAESSTVNTVIGSAQWSSPEMALTQWRPSQLPPEQTTFGADPFDLDWAERATAMARGQLAACFPPFSTTPLGQLSTAPPPHPPGAAVCTNPFLALPSDESFVAHVFSCYCNGCHGGLSFTAFTATTTSLSVDIGQMYDDDGLHSKYVRLGVEFKKLRERYRTIKDRLKESVDCISQLEAKLLDQAIHTRNLEHENDGLAFRNQYLIKQAAFLEKQLEAVNQKRGRSIPNGCFVEGVSQDDALKNALQEINSLRGELVSQSSKFLARIAELETLNSHSSKPRGVPVSVQTSVFSDLSPFTQSSSSVDATSSSLDAFCLQDAEHENFTTNTIAVIPHAFAYSETLKNSQAQSPVSSLDAVKTAPSCSLQSDMPTRKHSLPEHVPDLAHFQSQLSSREDLLLQRISQLENQLAEMSLQQRLEVRRNQLAQQTFPSAGTNDAAAISSTDFDASIKEKLRAEYYKEQLLVRTKQLTLYAGRMADAYEEIRSLHEHLRCVRSDVERHRQEAAAAATRADSLEEELESTKQRTAKQLTDMALHLANLTDDIHALRGSGSTACGAPKDSFFSSPLK
ncbi:Protein numb [Taenia crassiceps]|uniref:Protein numb n=1 Tax=Taenia crassiceps TaxID=6207 RepID=A0ABR4QN86_9CEST